ncbi:hypothetical protein D9C73_021345 [Collichthys lucidus]|uniref:Uncharacterized protein n=1 Tax=Collichthys lucidus TaxID=240159 RepID=A0A4U5VHG6_COLLU|nr:hypothetical protein D9C73_021345 [Collichthys lucidus]
MPHSCTAEVTAFLSTGGQTDGPQQPRRVVFDRAAASGAANKKLSNPRPPVREQWAKCRVSQCSFTQQLAEHQQVGTDSAPTQTTRGEPRHSEVETENSCDEFVCVEFRDAANLITPEQIDVMSASTDIC